MIIFLALALNWAAMVYGIVPLDHFLFEFELALCNAEDEFLMEIINEEIA